MLTKGHGTSLEHKDYAAAELYYRRMAMLDNAAPATIYGMALAAAGREDLDRARGLMRQIAPDKRRRLSAGACLARQGNARSQASSLPSENQIVEQHLLQSLAGDPAKH